MRNLCVEANLPQAQIIGFQTSRRGRAMRGWVYVYPEPTRAFFPGGGMFWDHASECENPFGWFPVAGRPRL